jgi:hypothetical protein
MHACMEVDWKHLLHEVLPIYMQEDPYLIGLLVREKYMDIMKKAPIGWVERVCIHFPIMFIVRNVVGTRLWLRKCNFSL